MIGRKPLLSVAVVWFAAQQLAALPADRTISQYVHRSWTVEQGLPHGTVRGFLQTPDGYLWLATYEGLVRFNGEEFRIFDRSSTPGMLSNAIRILCRTGKDTIWIGTNDGLMRYHDGRFEAVALPGGPATINGMIEASDGSLWVGTAGGKLIRIAGDRAEVMRLKLPAGQITALAVTGETIWIGTLAGLSRYTRGVAEPVAGLDSKRIVALAPDGAAALLVGTAAGLERVAGDRVERIDAGLPHDQVTSVHRDRNGNLWVGTYSHGLFRLGGGGVAAYGLADGLLNPTIRAISEDDEGSIWIGSNGGLEQFRAGAFINWGRRDGIDDDFVRIIFADRAGVLHAGSANGLYRRDGSVWIREEGPAGILSMEQSRDGTRWIGTSDGLYRISGGSTRLLTVADGLSNNSIRDLHEDRHGDLWVATDFSVNRIRADGRIESFARAGLAGIAIGIAETRDGRIWIAGGFGLAELDGERFKVHSAPRELPSNRLLFAIAADADADGTVWIATDGDGLIRFRDGRAARITTARGLASDKAVSLVDDGKGQLWFGTVRGVFAVSKHELNAVADGTASHVVSRFFDENDGLGSRQCNGAANPSALRTSDGRIWLATAKGVSALSGSSTPPPLRAPIIESVSFDGRPAAMEALRSIPPGVNRIEIDFTVATFQTPERTRVRYRVEGYDDVWIDGGTKRAITYTNLPAGEYRFLLESSRDGVRWRGTSLPFALRPHFYQTRWFLILSFLAVAALLLAAHNMRLHISRERARHLAVLVEDRTRQISEEKERTEEALRQTEAAKIEAEAARREAERHERLVEVALERAESASRAKSIFLANTSHELRTPLNAIIGFSGLLIRNAGSRLERRHVQFLENIQSSGEYLLGHINNVLDLSKIEAGQTRLQPEVIVPQDLVEEIAAVMKGVAMLRRVSIVVDIADDFPTIEADPTHVRQILYNLISNAVKFSPESSTVTIGARYLPPSETPPDSIEIRVADQGVGIDPKDHELIFQEFRQAQGAHGERPQGTGLGLTLVKRFVEMHGGTIRVESELGMGSVFIVVMPRTQSARAPRGPRHAAPVRTS